MRKLFYLLLLAGFAAFPTDSLGQFSLATTSQGGNGTTGSTFEVTALRTVRIHRLWIQPFSSGSLTAVIWGRMGTTNFPISTANGWTNYVPGTSITGVTAGVRVQIPVDLNIVLPAGQTITFYVGGGNTAYTTSPNPSIYADNNISINIAGYGGNPPTPTFFVRGYNGQVDYFTLGATNDAGVASIDSVSASCPGSQNIWTTIGNFGSNQLDSVTVNWSWNGALQTPIQLTTLLDTFNGTGSTTAPVFLGTRTFAAGQFYNVRVWTSNPNGVADTVNFNDTLSASVGASLSGLFTINSGAATGGSNFNNFTDAVDALNNFGVCGPVTFAVAANSGPYKEQISIGQIVGASSVNTITFDGGLTKEEIWVDAAMTGTSNRYVIQLDGSDYVTLKNLTINNHAASGAGTVYGTGIHLTNEADYNIIEDCIIDVDSAETQTSGNFCGIQMAGQFATSQGSNGSFNIIRNNKIHGGYYGITATGTTSGYEESNLIENNELTGQWYYNMYLYGQSGMVARGNYMEHRKPSNTFGYGMYLAYQDTMLIERNTIIDPLGYGIYMFRGNASASFNPPSGPAYVINNSVSGLYTSSSGRGIFVGSTTENVKFYHNSVSLTSGSSTASSAMYISTTTTNSNLDIQNNSFAVFNTTSGYALYTGSSNVSALDYNNYYNDGDTSRVIYLGSTVGLGALQGAGGFNTNSYHGDPLYLDNFTDMHSKGTQLWDRGNDTLGITEDIDGQLRPGFGGTTPDIGSDEFQPPQLDITPTVMLSPTLPVCPGSYSVIVNVQNLGQATVDTFTVNWTVNGVAQTPFVATSANLATNTGSTVSLGTVTIVGNTPYDIVFTTSGPNGGIDEDPANDTLGFYGLRTGIAAGNYVINSALPTGGVNYNSFQDAVDDLNAFGICGSVNFVVAPGSGPYNEQLTLGEVVGTSATSTITFDGGVTKEEVWVDSLTSSNDRAVIKIDGGDWITLKNLTISNYSPGDVFGYYGFGLHLQNEADHNTIEGCIIQVDTAQASTSGNFCGIAMSGTFATSSNPAGSFNTIQNNEIRSGYYGVTMRGNSSNDYEIGNRILNNTMTGQNYYNIYQYAQGASEIEGNIMTHRQGGSTFGYGIYNAYVDSFYIGKNQIIDPKGYGIYMFRANWSGTGNPPSYSRVENNMISGFYASTTRYGIAVSSNTRKVRFDHNSVSIPYDNAFAFRTISSFSVDSLIIRNSSFAVFGNGGQPVFLIDSAQIEAMNYNNFYAQDNSAIQMNNTQFDATNYRGAGGWNIASRYGDPGYIDNNNNLHALSSQLWNAGNNSVGILEDLDGDVRPDSFIVDIGADEFRPPAQEAAFVAFVNPVSACGYGSAASVSIEFQNGGLEPIDSIELSFRVNGGTVTSEWAYFNPGILTGARGTYTFTATANMSVPGSYIFDGWVNLPGDNVNLNDSLFNFAAWHDQNVGTFPYFEDFEAGPGGWRAEGPTNWQWGLPRQVALDTASSGVKAWMTDTTNNHGDNECGWLISPCYDFTNLNLPFIRMFINYDIEQSWDGTQLQATLDSGRTWFQVGGFNNPAGNPTNWYTDNTIDAFGLCLNLPTNAQEGWTGSSGGWIQSQITLDTLANEPSVRFRFYFASDQFVNEEGFAVDDIEIGDLPPNDLGVVEFLEPVSGVCGDSNTVVTVVVKNFGSVEQVGYPVTVAITDTPSVAVTTLTIVSPDTIFPGKSDTIIVGTFNTYAGGQFTLTAYTNLNGELDRSNDTTVISPIDIRPVPAAPVVNNQIFCEADSALLAITAPDSNFSYNWYATDTSSVALAEDTFQYQTPLLQQTTTYWVSQSGRDGGSPILFTEWNLGGTDMIEIANLSSRTIDATGWVVATSSSYSNINLVNTIVWQLGTLSAGQVDYRTDNTTNNYWGNNLFWNEGTGQSWVLLIDNNGNVVDAVFYNWSAADITNFNTTINGFTITAADIGWNGNGLAQGPAVTNSFDRIGNNDNDDATDWTDQLSANEGVLNNQISSSFSAGVGCTSARVPAQVIISPITPPNLGPDNVVCGGLLLDAGAGYASYTWNNGSMTQQNLVSTSGSYNVLVADANGCTGTDTINLIINPNPIVDLGADTTVCGSILLDAGNPGTSWTWQDGSISQTYLAAASQPYFVNVVDQNGCETRDTVNVTVNALPPVDLGMDRVVCDSVVLDAMNAGLPTVWSTGATSQTISVTSSGSYFVSVTDPATTCEALDTVNLTINVSPAVNLGPDGDYCDILILDAGNPGSLYNWSSGDLSQTVIVTGSNEGTFNVEVTDINGCAGTDTITVNIVDQPVIGFTSVRDPNLNDYDFTNNSTGEGLTYTWDFGDGSAVVNTRDATHTYAPGTYQACLTISNACDTLVQCIDVQSHGVGVEDALLANSINIYPNPTTDKVNIDISGLNQDVEITIFDVTGRILHKRVITRFEQANTTRFDLSDEAKGVYNLQFRMGERKLTRRLVLN